MLHAASCKHGLIHRHPEVERRQSHGTYVCMYVCTMYVCGLASSLPIEAKPWLLLDVAALTTAAGWL